VSWSLSTWTYRRFFVHAGSSSSTSALAIGRFSRLTTARKGPCGALPPGHQTADSQQARDRNSRPDSRRRRAGRLKRAWSYSPEVNGSEQQTLAPLSAENFSGEECPFCTTAFDNSHSAGLKHVTRRPGFLEIQVRIMQRHYVCILFGWMFVASCPIWGQVQNPSGAVDGEQNLNSSERSIEDLNLAGAETEMPPFSDSPIGIHSAFRQKLWDEGVFLRTVVQSQYAQNALQAPVPPMTRLMSARVRLRARWRTRL
jgi:hypothetical protein